MAFECARVGFDVGAAAFPGRFACIAAAAPGGVSSASPYTDCDLALFDRKTLTLVCRKRVDAGQCSFSLLDGLVGGAEYMVVCVDNSRTYPGGVYGSVVPRLKAQKAFSRRFASIGDEAAP